jgi:hypothetical protein
MGGTHPHCNYATGLGDRHRPNWVIGISGLRIRNQSFDGRFGPQRRSASPERVIGMTGTRDRHHPEWVIGMARFR